jgi:hypothetical protein
MLVFYDLPDVVLALDSLSQRPCFQWQRSCGLDVTQLISTQLPSVVSVLFDVPRRSSSRSVRQLMKEMELLIRSVFNLILAVVDRVYYVGEFAGV